MTRDFAIERKFHDRNEARLRHRHLGAMPQIIGETFERWLIWGARTLLSHLSQT